MKVSINMETLQTVDGETEVLTHSADGLRRDTDETSIITFVLNAVHNEMKIDRREKTVTVTQNHHDMSHIRYEEGLHHHINYRTVAGELPLGFMTRQVSIAEEQGGDIIHITLIYDMTQGEMTVSECELRIDISPK